MKFPEGFYVDFIIEMAFQAAELELPFYPCSELFQYSLIDAALLKCKGNKSKAARLLKLSRRTLQNYLKRREQNGLSRLLVYHSRKSKRSGV